MPGSLRSISDTWQAVLIKRDAVFSPLIPASADGDDHISLSRHFAAIPAPARKWSDNHRSVVLRQVPLLHVLLNSSSLFILPLAACTNRRTFISFTKILINITRSNLMEIGRCNVGG